MLNIYACSHLLKDYRSASITVTLRHILNQKHQNKFKYQIDNNKFHRTKMVND